MKKIKRAFEIANELIDLILDNWYIFVFWGLVLIIILSIIHKII
jgi:hypothetical protein